jgi:hypothetical protein
MAAKKYQYETMDTRTKVVLGVVYREGMKQSSMHRATNTNISARPFILT